MKTYLLLK